MDNDWPTAIDVCLRLWDVNDPNLRTYFGCFHSDRATISDHDNPVFKNLADEVYSRQKLSGEHYNGFEEQEILTNELLVLQHKFYNTHRTVIKTVVTIMYAEAIKCRT